MSQFNLFFVNYYSYQRDSFQPPKGQDAMTFDTLIATNAVLAGDSCFIGFA